MVLPPQAAASCLTRASHHTSYCYGFFTYMQEQRDLLVLLVESDVDVDELGEKATSRIIDYSYRYFLEKII